MEFCLLLILIGFCSGAVANGLVKLVIARASRWGALDLPNERKIHKAPIPRLGGLSIIPGVWLGASIALVLSSRPEVIDVWAGQFSFARMSIGFMLGSFGMFMLGTVDDLKRISASKKLVFQIIIAVIAFQFLPMPESILGFNVPAWLCSALMLGWLILIPNSVNLLDGVDGLTGSLFLLFSFCLGLLAVLRGEFIWLLILAPMFTATLAFLRHNWNPARIFLGDSGSLTLGFTVAYFSLAFSMTSTSLFSQNWNLALTISLTSIWLMDTLYAIVRRYAKKAPSLEILFRRSKVTYLLLHSKALRNVIEPDRHHFHHRLISLGLGAKQVVLVLAGFWVSIILIGSSWMIAGEPQNLMTMSGFDSGLLVYGTSLLGLVIISANCYVLWRRMKPRVKRKLRPFFWKSKVSPDKEDGKIAA